MKNRHILVCASLMVAAGLWASELDPCGESHLSPCEQKASAVPSDSWSAEEWEQHKAATERWKEKKGVDRYNEEDEATHAQHIPDGSDLEAGKASIDAPEQASDEEQLAYQVPSDSWSKEKWEEYRKAKAAVDAQ